MIPLRSSHSILLGHGGMLVVHNNGGVDGVLVGWGCSIIEGSLIRIEPGFLFGGSK